MANDGQIVFEVTADGKHAIADIKEITRAIQQETGKWDNAAKQSTDNIGNSFGGMLKKIAAGFSVAKIGQALLDLGKQAVNAASDLQEVQNVVDVTFGENANQIEKWAKNAGTQFGLTETQAKRFSSTMGAMLKSSGLAGEKIVDVSTDLAGLAADMASFYNLDFDTAFQKIRSGISGQTMPLKELGIDMSVATLNAFALQKGLSKTFNDMSQGEQTMLRYQYLMQATADAQGDFARTSDGYANSMRKLQTNVEALKTTLGKGFIEVVAEAVGCLNGFLEKLLPDESKRTVLDDFADIDLKTDEKLAQIRSTAEEAHLLTEELDKIGGSKANKAGSKIQQMVDDLSKINLDQGKAGAVSDFIGTLAENIELVSAIQGTDADGAKAWLDGIASSANNLDANDAKGWETLLNTIKEGLPGIENTDFGAAFFSALGGGFSDVSEQSSVLQWAVDSLGNKTNKTAHEQALWLDICKRLVHTIPGLSSIINTETGEIKGGTQAVDDYITAWENGQKKLALLNAQAEKRKALAEKHSELPSLEVDMMLWNDREKKAKAQLQKYYKELGVTAESMQKWWNGRDFGGIGYIQAEELGLTEEQRKFLNEEAEYYDTVLRNSQAATKQYEAQQSAYEEGLRIIEEGEKVIEETYGATEQATQAAEDWSDSMKEAGKESVTAAQEAISALEEYVASVRESVSSSIDSTIKGFEFIGDASQRQAKRLEPLEKELKNLQEEGKELGDINVRISDATDMYGLGNLKKNLDSQVKFLQEYKQDMEAAQAKGFSKEFLAQFADGSQESAEWLHELAKASETDVEQLNELYSSLDEGKKELTNTLTEQKLSVDQVYQSLADKAKEAVAALDLEGDAAENSGKTVAGIARGISDHVSDVQEAVDSIIAQLERLEGYGINIDFGGFGSINFTTTTGKTEGSGRMGLDFVPHDDYIARLHEGERVLTAQENQIWNSLLNGGVAGFDLESLGGVMRDNIKAGGNVYLDGKVVGAVVSDRQGKSYKSLQRSGWQS